MTEELPEIPGFRYVRPLGKNVHLYRDDGGEVAVKLLVDPARAAEMRTVLRLGHPGIVTVHRAGRTRAGLLYLVMKYYTGGDAGALAPLRFERVVEMGVQLADALHTAHQAGVVHRDVKPANVLLDESGQACLTDFGVLGRDRLPWTAPEVITSGSYSVRADVFSLAATLWHLLTGHPPFVVPRGNNTHAALEQRILRGSPPPTGRAPQPLEVLLQRSMAADPALRPASAEEFGLRLRAIHGGPVASTSASDAVAVHVADPAPRKRKRWPVYATVAAVAVGVLGTGGVLLLDDKSLPTSPEKVQPQAAADGASGPSSKVTVNVARMNPTTLRFSWTYPSPAQGDKFAWRTNDELKSGTVEQPTIELYAPGALCIQVQVVRADGSNASDNTWSPEGCGF